MLASLRPTTLTARLVASMLGLFLAVSLAIGAATILATQHYLSGQIDADLQRTAVRIAERDRVGGGVDWPRTGTRGGGPPVPGGSNALLHLVTSPSGAVQRDSGGNTLNSVVTQDGTTITTLSANQIQTLLRSPVGEHPSNVDLGGDIGSYRVLTKLEPDGDLAFTGVPTSALNSTLATLTAILGLGSLAGLVFVGAGSTWLVRRSLEPLHRVAATARSVSQQELARGDVSLAERVPEADTDSRTEVGQVGLAMNHMLDNVSGALQARHESETRVRQFVADASHELRTPLASIRGYAELTRREQDPVPSSVVHALSRVESEAVRMQGLVEDLLLLARLDAGRPLDREPVDLTVLTVDAVSDARAVSPAHRWELELPNEPITVTGDEPRLRQILGNLLTNARSHTPEGTLIVTRVRRTDTGVEISVRDNGPGIPGELQREVFERFTRGDSSRNRSAGSSGLGLSIVQAVTAAHGGTVQVHSASGETTFTVNLPH